MQKREKKAEKSESQEKKEEIIISLKGSEIIEREASKFGTGAHVIIPKEYIGKKVKIIFDGGEDG